MKILHPLALLLMLASGAAGRAEPIELKIGATIPLSGPLAHVGKDIQRGMELGVEDFGSDTLRFKLLFEDNQHQAAQAASSAQKLLQREAVNVLISLWDMADVAAPLAEAAKTPHLAIRWNPHVAERHAYTFTVESTYKTYVLSTFDFLKALKVRTVALITEEAQGWVLGDEYFKSLAAARGIEIAGAERILVDDRDVATSVLRAVKHKPELVLLFTNPPLTELVIKQLRRVAPRQAFTGFFEVLSDPSLVEGIPFVAQFDASDWFVDRFKARYGESFTSRAPQAYDIIKLVALAYDEADRKLSGEELVHALSRFHDVPGASGTLNVSSTRNIESDCAWKIGTRSRFARAAKEDLSRFASRIADRQ